MAGIIAHTLECTARGFGDKQTSFTHSTSTGLDLAPKATKKPEAPNFLMF